MDKQREKEIKKLERAFKLLEATDGNATEELQKAVEFILQLMVDVKNGLQANIDSTKSQLDQQIQQVSNEAGTITPQMKERLNFLNQQIEVKVASLSEQVYLALNQVRQSIPKLPSPPDLAGLENRITTEFDKKLLEAEDSPEEVRDKLSSLIGDQRLDKSAIKGLDEELTAIKSLRGGFISGKARNTSIQYYDLSASLDGNTKAFTLPRKLNKVLTVQNTSFPTIFRPTVDYTMNGNVLTFSSEIDAATSLASGQTIIILYESLFTF